MLMAHGFLRAIFEVFERYQTPVDMVSTSEVSVSLTVDNTRHLPEIVEDLNRIARVSHEGNMAIVCLVGDNVRLTPGVLGKVFKAVENTNVRMVSQGASLLNISFVIKEEHLKDAVSRLHRAFFRELDPKVFE
jgi:aspartate kinase